MLELLNQPKTDGPQQLTKPKQLLVEGKDAVEFFHPFIQELGLSDIQIHNYKGISELAAFLKLVVVSPHFKGLPVTSIGIIRDAETDAKGAFDSACSSLSKANLPLPGKLGIAHSGCKTGVFILPDGKNSGMIETLILRAVEREPAFYCIDNYLDCVARVTGIEPKIRDKARFLTFLASKPDIKPLTGYAARAGYLKFESEAYIPLKQFLLDLFI